ELAKRGLQRQREARERVIKRAVARGEMGLFVTDAMVRQEMSRQAVELMHGKVDVNLCRAAIKRLEQAVVLRKKFEVKARAHFRRWASKRIMRGWRRWAALKADGMDRKLMTGYKGGERLRYNVHKVAAFARRREMLGVFLAWARKSSQLAIATRMQRKKLTEVMAGVFDTWRSDMKKSKQITVGMWADFSLKDLGEPFRMWYIFTDFSKKQTKEQERLLKLFRRAKNRKKVLFILKAWKHLAVYGRIEGMYTRSQLMASLAEQKEHTLRLVGKVDDLAGGLGDMEELAMEYRSQMIIRQRETSEREDGMDRQSMALHHAEQEIARLQCLLDSAAGVAPHICKAIHKVAPGFGFKERGLQPFTRARVEAMEQEVEDKVQELVAQRTLMMQADAANNKQSGDGGLPSESNTAKGGHSTPSSPRLSGSPRTAAAAAAARLVPTADAQTQARLPADPEAAARAAVAAAALAQGIRPPVLPRELARLDRVEWVLRRTSVAEVAARLKRQREQEELHKGSEGGDRPAAGRRPEERQGKAWSSSSAGSSTQQVVRGDDRDKQGSGNEQNGGGGGGGGGSGAPLIENGSTAAAAVVSGASSPPPTIGAIGETAAVVATASAAPPQPSGDGGDGGDGGGGTEGGWMPTSTPTIINALRHRGRVGDDSTGEDEEDDGTEDDVADRLAGIFEFLRSGNSLLLPPDLREDWDSRPDLGLGLLSADDHTDDLVRRYNSAPSPSLSRPATTTAADNNNKNGGLSYNFTASGGSGKGISTWVKGLCREARGGNGEPMTYHDLRMALTATAPRGRRSETTNDMLERRLVERRNRADAMTVALWGNDRQDAAENLY
ncbi:unnamed protein product, partial [Pylaiella littoralis]